MKKVFSVLLSLVMLMSLLSVGVAVSAATPDTQVIEAAAGETIQIKFSEDDCYGVSGFIKYSNRNLFSSLTVGGTTSYGRITEDAFILDDGANMIDCEVVLTVKISADAKVGDECKVEFYDCELAENNVDFSGRSGYIKTVTVKVVKKDEPTSSSSKPSSSTSSSTKPSEPSKTEPSKTEPSKTKPSTSTTKPSTTKPTSKPTTKPSNLPTRPGYSGTTNSALDYTRLIEQINIAQSRNQYDWTRDSWAKLESALNYAFQVLYNARTQKEIDDAADALAEAIANLVPIDGDDLRDLIQEILDWLEENDKEGLFADLYAALVQAKDALESGDQDAINEAYEVLLKAFEALQLQWPDLFGDTIIQEAVEAEECKESCHVWNGFWKSKAGHTLLVILLIVSLIINLVLAVLIVLYFIKRNSKSADKTPLVDYNINDD